MLSPLTEWRESGSIRKLDVSQKSVSIQLIWQPLSQKTATGEPRPPKRPTSAYLYYVVNQRSSGAVDSNFEETAKGIGRAWKALSAEGRRPLCCVASCWRRLAVVGLRYACLVSWRHVQRRGLSRRRPNKIRSVTSWSAKYDRSVLIGGIVYGRHTRKPRSGDSRATKKMTTKKKSDPTSSIKIISLVAKRIRAPEACGTWPPGRRRPGHWQRGYCCRALRAHRMTAADPGPGDRPWMATAMAVAAQACRRRRHC